MKLVPKARVATVAETAAVSVANGASRAGKQRFKAPTVHPIRPCRSEPGLQIGNRYGDFQEAPRRKCGGWNAKGIRPPNARKSRRKAAGITSESDRDTGASKSAAASDPAADLSTI